jgi:hypothetical protein
MVERLHRVIHDSISHYIDFTDTNWDDLLPFFLIACRATTQHDKVLVQSILIHGREMVVPNEGTLKAKISPDIQNADQVQ